MNVNEYISSGVLELYCAGALTNAESAEVEQMARRYPEVNAELNAIQNTLNTLAQTHALTPPPSVKANIMKAIEAESSNSVGKIKPATKVASIWGMSEGMARFAVAASLILFVLSASLAWYYSGQLNNAEHELASLKDTYNQSQQQVAVLTSDNDKMKHNMGMLNDMHTVKVVLNGVPAHPGMAVAVYWNTQNKTVMLDPGNLPAPPQGMQYQLWAIGKGGPVDAGVFVMDSSMHQMKDAGEALAFAVTLEKAGGSPAPNLTQLYVMGKPEGVSL